MMKHRYRFFFVLITAWIGSVACTKQNSEPDGSHSNGEKPIQHLTLDAITSAAEAARVFSEEVGFIASKQDLTPAALHEIHMSTYSLEKAVAYFVENASGPRREQAEEIAAVVEDIHLASENNRPQATKESIEQLVVLAKKFPLEN